MLPVSVFDRGELTLQVGRRLLRLLPLPGHSPDGIGVLVEEDRVLFAGDVMMPVPYVVDGDLEEMIRSLRRLPKMRLESLVQGHGEVILRGEVASAVRANISYLNALARHVRKAARRRDPDGYLKSVDVESCGKSRILLNGLAQELHLRNLLGLHRKWYGQPEAV